MFGFQSATRNRKQRVRVGTGEYPRTQRIQLNPTVEIASDFLQNFRETEELIGTNLPRVETRPLDIDGAVIGGRELALFTGPAQVQSSEDTLHTVIALQNSGLKFARSPLRFGSRAGRDFVSERHLKLFSAAAKRFNLRMISTVDSISDLSLVANHSHVLEVLPEHAGDTRLLRELGRTDRTILLHRGHSMTLGDLYRSVEQINHGGNVSIVLVESGIRTVLGEHSPLIDISSVLTMQRQTYCPVMVNLTPVVRDWSYVEQLATAAVGAGVNGLIFEIDPDPSIEGMGRGRKVLPEYFSTMIKRLEAMRATHNALALSRAMPAQ